MKCKDCRYCEYERIGQNKQGRYYCVHPEACEQHLRGAVKLCLCDRGSKELKIKTAPRWCPLNKKEGTVMKELIKKEEAFFQNVFEGTNGNKRVWCCLDDNSVRYTISINGKQTVRKEFANDKKELCFKNAVKALNKED